MSPSRRGSCFLCQRSEETKVAGALSTKDGITAHQKCLSFSAGIFPKSKGHLGDLFGYAVDDVKREVKRGSKLTCNICKKKGATSGCEVKSCRRRYHYPCAIQGDAQLIEDSKNGKNWLYCFKHCKTVQQNNSSAKVFAFTTSRSSRANSRTALPKVYCLACEELNGNGSLECSSDSIFKLYCDEHKALSLNRNKSEDSTAARVSVFSSGSNTRTRSAAKRQLSGKYKNDETPSKQKSKSWKRTISNDSSNSGDNVPSDVFAPLESDPDESPSSAPEPPPDSSVSKVPESPAVSNTDWDHNRCSTQDLRVVCKPLPIFIENHLAEEIQDLSKDEEGRSLLSTESWNIMPPVEAFVKSSMFPESSSERSTQTDLPTCRNMILVKAEEVIKTIDGGSIPGSGPGTSPMLARSPSQLSPGPSAPEESSGGHPVSLDHSKPFIVNGSCINLTTPTTPPCSPAVSLFPISLPHLEAGPSLDSASFWKSCNAAGCTQAIFEDLMNEVKNISRRILSDEASQQDYDVALNVMEASGKFSEFVAQQQQDLEKKQLELQKALAAMEMVVSALRCQSVIHNKR